MNKLIYILLIIIILSLQQVSADTEFNINIPGDNDLVITKSGDTEFQFIIVNNNKIDTIINITPISPVNTGGSSGSATVTNVTEQLEELKETVSKIETKHIIIFILLCIFIYRNRRKKAIKLKIVEQKLKQENKKNKLEEKQ